MLLLLNIRECQVVIELWGIHLEMKGIDIQNGYRWIIDQVRDMEIQLLVSFMIMR